MADGLCECGCRQRTNLARGTDGSKGWVKGQPVRFIAGHQNRRTPTQYIVDEATGCWEWQWYRSPHGYGQIWTGEDTEPAHRVYYERAHGPVPAGLELDHLCRNRGCVNPAHLEPVTRAENIQRGAGARLTWADVRMIRTSALTDRDLAARFEIAHSTVNKVRQRQSWWPDPLFSDEAGVFAARLDA